MTNEIKTDAIEKERILSYKMSQVFTEEDLKSISGAAKGSTSLYSYNQYGKYDSETDDSFQDALDR